MANTAEAAAAAAAEDSELVPVREADHLEQDPPMRGQRYACLSFVSPEDVLASKDAFVARRFVSKLAADVSELLGNLETVFEGTPAATTVNETVRMIRERHAPLWDENALQSELRLFRTQSADILDDAFRAEHGRFRTTVRGFKIRGSYDTLEQAQERARTLRRTDDRFHVFVAEVGCWCPWSPSAEELADTEYAETQLNTLVKKYKEGMVAQEELYNQRRDLLVNDMDRDRKMWVDRAKKGAQLSSAHEDEHEKHAGGP